ncbi:MAG TPA: hypothetical protein VFK47_18905 [Ktedonobacteraceae bacterium]|nr:hypothetical protein [Ktedonobacteraceae bacterium]
MERHARTESNLSLKSRAGRMAARIALVAAGATTTLMGIASIEASTNHEAQAVAYDPTGMNGAEKSWCKWPSRFRLCAMTKSFADQALTKAQEVALKTGTDTHNGGADAFRHCYWNGLMTQSFGIETAKGFADRHENKDTEPQAEAEMDNFNNAKGREWAAGGADPYDRCLSGILHGELKTLVR